MISEGSNYTGQNFTDYLSDNSLEGYDKNTSRPLHEVDIGFLINVPFNFYRKFKPQ